MVKNPNILKFFLLACAIAFTWLAILWRKDDGQNFAYKTILVGMAIWSILMVLSAYGYLVKMP